MALGTTLLLLQLAVGSPADARILRDAREAQQRFEVTRRWNLPRGTSRSSGQCDARIGRWCYWYDSTETKPPPEPAKITAARKELNASLEVASRVLPHDSWVAGQRVRYLIEGGELDAAVRAARACAAAPWWCSALEGLALHVSQRYVEADSAFNVALAGMSAERRCAWIDLRRLATGALSRELGSASCEDRYRLARRLWHRNKPLWSTPGDDGATEFFARQTMAELLTSSATAYGTSFGPDQGEMLLRYGWPEWFTRQDAPSYLSSEPVTGHHRAPSYPYVQTGRAPASRYAALHVSWMGELRHQLARFPRGDSMLLVAAYRVSDTALARDSVVGSIATSTGTSARVVASGTERSLLAMVPADTAIASIEVLGTRGRRVERARYTVEPLPCARWCLSDLLLFAAHDSAADLTVGQAARNATAGQPVGAAAPLGIYWEATGVGATPLELSLTIEPLRVSRIRRAAARIKLASEPTTVRLRWIEVPDSTGIGHTLSLRLPPTARGRLRILLTVEPRGMPAQTAVREIDVR